MDKRPNRIDFLGVPLDLLSMHETLALVDRAMRDGQLLWRTDLNVGTFANLQSDPDLRAGIVEGDVINVDGMGIVWGCGLLGHGNVERVAGVDLMYEVLALCARRGYRPYFFGAKPDVVKRAEENARRKFPGLVIAGYRNGYFRREDEPAIVEEIKRSGASCLFIGITSPIKERFARTYRHQLGVSFVMGVGGSLDVLAGAVRRAPMWMQKAGLEWLFRIAQEPQRLMRRYVVTNAIYAGILARALLSRRLARSQDGEKRLPTTP